MRLGEGIGSNLRKDDTCDSVFAIFLSYLSMILANYIQLNKKKT